MEATIAIAETAARFDWTLGFDGHDATIDNPTPWNFSGCRLAVRDRHGGLALMVEEPERHAIGLLAPFRQLAGRFLQAVAGSGSMTPGFADGLRVQTLIAAAERSAADDRPVPIHVR